MGKNKKIKKYKKTIKSCKKGFSVAVSRELSVVAFCLKTISDYQNSDFKEKPEVYGAYAMAMEVLALLGVEAEIYLDDEGFNL